MLFTFSTEIIPSIFSSQVLYVGIDRPKKGNFMENGRAHVYFSD